MYGELIKCEGEALGWAILKPTSAVRARRLRNLLARTALGSASEDRFAAKTVSIFSSAVAEVGMVLVLSGPLNLTYDERQRSLWSKTQKSEMAAVKVAGFGVVHFVGLPLVRIGRVLRTA